MSDLKIINTSQGYIHKYEEKVKVKVHPCTGTEALYRPYGP